VPHPPNLDESFPSRAADELLVVRCQLGEPDAFDALIGRWHRPLWRYIRRMTGHDEEAQDVEQEVWLRVIRGIARLQDGSRLRGWLFGIARRALMDRLRREYATPILSDVDPGDLVAESESIDNEADLAALEAALDTLPAVERDVLTLFYLRDLSLAELADALNVPVGTVKSRLFRARRLLRAAMLERSDA
jgi:RNA polymerase sigma-70 factor (ECF subfamily)